MTRQCKLAWTLGSLGAIAVTLATIDWHINHSFSTAIRWKGERACRFVMPCVFNLGQVFPGDWDHIVVFDMAASQEEIDSTVGTGIKRPDNLRLIVFMKGSRIVRSITEHQGIEHPEPGEVFFGRVSITQNHFSIDRNANFVLAKGAPSCEECRSLELIRPGEVVE